MLGRFFADSLKQVGRKPTVNDGLSGLVAGLIPVVQHFRPELKEVLDTHLWMVLPFGVAGALLVRLATAPFHAWKDARLAADAAEARLAAPAFKVREAMAARRAVVSTELAEALSHSGVLVGANIEMPDDVMKRVAQLLFELEADPEMVMPIIAYRKAVATKNRDTVVQASRNLIGMLYLRGTV